MNKKLDKSILDIVNQLVNKYKAQKIIMFGSAARSNFSRDSDLDFLIVKSDTPEYGLERMREVEKLIDTDYPCDFIVARPDELEERLSMGDPFIKTIFEEGIVLYDR